MLSFARITRGLAALLITLGFVQQTYAQHCNNHSCTSLLPTMGQRIWATYRTEDRSGTDSGPFGSFPIDGELDGIVLGLRSRNVGDVFRSFEFNFMEGSFTTTDGLKTNYDEFQVEGLVGGTRSLFCDNVMLTPYTGLRYRSASNDIRGNLTVQDAYVEQYVWSVPVGVRSDLMLTDCLSVGLDGRLQWKFFEEQIVQSTAFPDDFIQEGKDRLTYRLDLPVSWRPCANGEFTFKPFYEWDRFDSTDSTRGTRIDEQGVDFSLAIIF